MSNHVALQPNTLSTCREKYSPEMLQHIGMQVEALVSQHSSLEMYRRSIERQLAFVAAQIQEEGIVLLPRNVFLLLELRGSGGVSTSLEQIAHILGEVGYWKPSVHVENYYRQDVYRLGKSAQRLFDDYEVLNRRVEQLHAQLRHIKDLWNMELETTPQKVFEGLAMATERVKAQAGVDAIVELLEQTTRHGWFRWLFPHRGSKKIMKGIH